MRKHIKIKRMVCYESSRLISSADIGRLLFFYGGRDAYERKEIDQHLPLLVSKEIYYIAKFQFLIL